MLEFSAGKIQNYRIFYRKNTKLQNFLQEKYKITEFSTGKIQNYRIFCRKNTKLQNFRKKILIREFSALESWNFVNFSSQNFPLCASQTGFFCNECLVKKSWCLKELKQCISLHIVYSVFLKKREQVCVLNTAPFFLLIPVEVVLCCYVKYKSYIYRAIHFLAACHLGALRKDTFSHVSSKTIRTSLERT